MIFIVVYTVACYGDLWSAHPKYEYGAPVALKDSVSEVASTVFYKEGFVNLHKEGTASHVSSITPLSDGRVMAAWYSGSREGAGDVSILTSIYEPTVGSWSKERAVVTRSSASKELGRYIKKLGNPVIFTDAEERLWLVYVTVSIGGWSGSSLNYKVSLDSGSSWSQSVKLVTGPLFNVSTLAKNKPVLLDNGAWILPVYHEFLNKFPELLFLTPFSTPEKVGLDGRNRRTSFAPGVLQGSLLVTGHGELRAFYRNATETDKRYVLTSLSSDNGKTWTPPLETTLPNPDSGLDVTWAGNGRALIVLNDTFSNRSRLALYSSADSGVTWTEVKVLEDSEGREFSYPSIVRTPEGIYHVTYTYDRQRIKHITFSEAWLKGQSNG